MCSCDLFKFWEITDDKILEMIQDCGLVYNGRLIRNYIWL